MPGLLFLLVGVVACTTQPLLTNSSPLMNSSLPIQPSSEGRALYTFHAKNWVDRIAWSPDSTRVAEADSKGLNIWDALTGAHVVTLAFPGARSVPALAWSPDGKEIALTNLKTVEIWNVTTGKLVRTYTGHTANVEAVAWSPNDRFIASGGDDRQVQIWDAGSGKLSAAYHGHTQSVLSIAWSPDSQRVASSDGSKAFASWDAAHATSVRLYTVASVSTFTKIAWSPDGTKIAALPASAPGGAYLVNAVTGQILRTYYGYGPSSYSHNKGERFAGISWSPDNQRLAMWGEQTGGLEVWDVATGSYLYHFVTASPPGSYDNTASDVAWSPNGKYIAAGANSTVQIWDASPGSQAFVVPVSQPSALSLAWSPNGKYIASTSDNYPTHTLLVWEARTGRVISTYQSKILLGTISWAPDSQRLAVGELNNEKSNVDIFDALGGKLLAQYSRVDDNLHGSIHGLSWSHNGKRLAAGDQFGTIQVWNVQSKQFEGKYDLPAGSDGAAVQASSVSWSPDDHLIAVSSTGVNSNLPGSVVILAVNASSLTLQYVYQGHRAGVFTAAWSPDGKNIASAGVDQVVQVWVALTGKLLYTYRGHVEQKQTGAIQQVAWSPDGKRIASVSDNETTVGDVQIWDALTGNHVYVFTGHLSKVSVVAWSPDSHYIVTAGSDNQDNTVQICFDQQ
ncbi:hypothetical protein KSC_102220 [Ktedonobacter sp. SOSP1-52]|uniref:WD40 repeat domain-containing protein n=1 Tax=Ktedonobacter sp. SOSP1-52 TaxID=2778366 RepID=UPI0019165A4D|nr:WD40 repeat domain-containing protein [Ktedonobacter sp. SOSP1-52]GHO71330.1 hypothetical protein KSC_102220 [Ktedonobacter sp. SOSP1-52]